MFSIRPRREAISSRPHSGFKRTFQSERGSVAVSVILIPLALLVVFSTIQLALVFHGRNVVAAAAEDALYIASQFGADEGDGEAAADRILDLYSGLDVDDLDVDKGDKIVTVTITGRVIAPLSFFSDFEIGASGPVEEFRRESERG